MILAWIRFGITAILLIAALISFASAVTGAYRFGFVLNRVHAAGIGDTLGLFLVVAALVISSDALFDSLKLMLLVFFMWFTSPVSTHFLGQAEYFTDPQLSSFIGGEYSLDAAKDPQEEIHGDR